MILSATRFCLASARSLFALEQSGIDRGFQLRHRKQEPVQPVAERVAVLGLRGHGR